MARKQYNKKQRVNIGDRIKKLRGTMGQKELAEKAGISVSSLSSYEQNKSEPPLFTASELADALGVSLDFLVKERTEPVEQIIESKTGLSTDSVRMLKRWENYCKHNSLANPVDMLLKRKEFHNAVNEMFVASKILNFDFNGGMSEEVRKTIHNLNVLNIIQGDDMEDYKISNVELARLHVEDAKSRISEAIDKIRTEEEFKNGKR